MDKSPFQTPKRLLEQSGKGTLRRVSLFPGVELSRTLLCSEQIFLEHEALSGILEVNHCRSGRIGWTMAGGTSIYLGPGDLGIHTMDCCAVSTISLPLGHYEGITVALDLERLAREPLPFLREAGVDPGALLHKFRSSGAPLALPAAPEIAHIFDPLYSASERLRLPYYRLKALELLLFLEELVPEREPQLGQYHAKQVEVIKEIHALLTADLRQRHTIEELSRKYLINTATLKAVFKAVYSQPIGAYMKEFRLRRAMDLLRESDRSIAEIGAQVGYESQGNFAEAFKALTHLSPSAYRRACQNTAETDGAVPPSAKGIRHTADGTQQTE